MGGVVFAGGETSSIGEVGVALAFSLLGVLGAASMLFTANLAICSSAMLFASFIRSCW